MIAVFKLVHKLRQVQKMNTKKEMSNNVLLTKIFHVVNFKVRY